MKLRNKKTGKIVEGLISAYGISGDVAVSVMDRNEESGYADLGRYKTLAELNEEWEDYKPMKKVYENVKVIFDEESSYLYIYDNGKQVGFFYANEEDK